MARALVDAADTALVAVAVAKRETFLVALRAQMYRVAAVHFDNQRIALENALRERGQHLNETVCREDLGEDIESILTTIFDEFKWDMARSMMEILVETMTGAIRHRTIDFSAELSFNLRNPVAEAYLKEYCLGQIKQIDATTLKVMRGIIHQGLADGLSYTEIARRMTAKYSAFGAPVPQKHLRNRAELIATYETGQAYESASRQTVEILSARGIPIEKRSVTVGDDRVDEECLRNEREGWIPLHQAHTSGHQHPLFHVACRCVAVYRLARVAALKRYVALNPSMKTPPVEFFTRIK